MVDADDNTYAVIPASLDVVPVAIGHIALPVPYLPASATFKHEASKRLARNKLSKHTTDVASPGAIKDADDVPALARKGLRRIDKLDLEIGELRRAIQSDVDSLARQFERVIQILEERGHLVGWELTPSGDRVARLYHESDLYIVEAMQAGLLDDLPPAELAAVVSTFVYETRGRDDGATPWFPNGNVRQRFGALLELHHQLAKAERALLIPETRQPDAGFIGIVHGWASGHDLTDLTNEREITPGDFVRTVKLLVDLLRQIGTLAPNRATARAARQAADLVFRDLVAVTTDFEGLNDTDAPELPEHVEALDGDS
ncbi:MAG: hypothetical protein R2706_08990 [Acidimicrobiales bacterium]